MTKNLNEQKFNELEYHIQQLKSILNELPETSNEVIKTEQSSEFPGFIVKLLKGNDEFRILDKIGNIKKYFDIQEEFDFQFVVDNLYEKNRSLFLKHLTESDNQQIKLRNDYQFINSKSDTPLWFDIAILPEGIKSNKLTLIFVENSERKVLDEREREVSEIDKSASLKSLVHCIAHEINNPNHNIMQNISLLENGWPDIMAALDEFAEEKGGFSIKNVQYTKIRDYLSTLIEKILSSSRQIKEITDDLRAFSQKSQNQMFDQINLNHLVEKTIDLVRQQINGASGNFKVLYSPNMIPILGNYNQLQQVLINLIHNSIDALTDYTQEIKIFTFFNKEDHFVGVGVSDKGKGIPKERIKTIFNHFQNIKTGGNGLGLPISKEIIDYHNGEININSQINDGTTVVFKLPVKPGRK